MGNEEKKGKERLAGMWQKASEAGKDFGKKVADGVQTGTRSLMESAQNTSYSLKMKIYNPVFPKQYKSKHFNRPNMIVIVDDAVRRGIDVCEGAIGWLSTVNGVEVLYLYDEWVNLCGIQFVPAAVCDEIYYVDRFDHGRYIRVDCIFGKAHEEKMAELEHIAFSLGAKSFTVEIEEYNSEIRANRKKVDGSHRATISRSDKREDAQTTEENSNLSVTVGHGVENSVHHIETKSYSGRNTTFFEGSNEPQQPQLKWFSQDDGIKRLIEMRCSDKNAIKSKVLELEGSISATMSQKTACAIDGALDKIMNTKANLKMEFEAKKERRSKLIYHIEF